MPSSLHINELGFYVSFMEIYYDTDRHSFIRATFFLITVFCNSVLWVKLIHEIGTLWWAFSTNKRSKPIWRKQ